MTNPQPEIDLQAEQINRGLTTLFELLDKPVARNALDLVKNADTATKYEILKRLRKSLRQYLGREGDLFYVGLLGHFSAGKSSTINSLLRDNGSNHERSTGLHPTDTVITLLTQSKNTASILQVTHEGNVVIRQQPVEHPLLDRLVIADTPGTGDPELAEEIARDFLPICDLILFLLSAATPIDESDVPLLRELHDRLPFIPIQFVITRADELRADHHKPLSDANLDEVATENFVAGVIVRLGSLLKHKSYTAKDFILLDNKAGFHVAELRQLLEQKSKDANALARATMHVNKLQFYRSTARELRSFFEYFLDGKLTEISKIVTAAARNIDQYQQIVQISNNNLTKAWVEHNNAISGATVSASERVKPIVILPEDQSNIVSVARKRTDIQNDLRKEAGFVAGSISSNLQNRVNAAIQDHFYKIQTTIADTDLEKLTASAPAVQGAKAVYDFRDLDIVPSGLLVREFNDWRQGQADAFREALSSTKKVLRELHDVLLQRAPLVGCEEVVSLAQDTLTKDLSQFFRNVELYRNGVFSLSTKESIATLGIGQQLDLLEAAFTEDDKSALTANAVGELFPGFVTATAKLTTRFAQVAEKTRTVLDAAENQKLENPESGQDVVARVIPPMRNSIQEDVLSELQSEVDRLCGNVGIQITNLIIDAKAKLNSDVEGLEAARRRRLFWVGVLTAVLIVGFEFIYHRLHLPAPYSMLGQLVLAIVGGLITETVVLVVSSIRHNLPRMVSNTKEKHRAKLNDLVRDAVSSALQTNKFGALERNVLATRLQSTYEHIVFSKTDAWHDVAARSSRTIRNLQSEYSALRLEFLTLVEEIRKVYSAYFKDASQNLEVLESVAKRIKERAIEPSFALLNETRLQLEFVKKEMGTVDFL